MSIRDQIRIHEHSAEAFEKMCTRHLLHGDLDLARWYAKDAAKERHLVYELEDTDSIAWAALMEYVDERRVARADSR